MASIYGIRILCCCGKIAKFDSTSTQPDSIPGPQFGVLNPSAIDVGSSSASQISNRMTFSFPDELCVMAGDVARIENDVGVGLPSYHNLNSRERMHLHLARKADPSQISRRHMLTP